jgi:phage major head subunit gpT-like protein
MALKSLSSRAILGEFMRNLEQPADHGFVEPLSHFVPDSDQFKEEHRFVGAVPGFIEWTGTRRVKELMDYVQEVENNPYEATLTVTKDEVKYDKTGQVQNRIAQHAQSSVEHWEKLLSHLINVGSSGIAYDGHYFFDTSHQEGDSGTMSNLLTIDLDDIPILDDYKGTATNPSALQMAHAILKAIQQMYTFQNDRGEPINQSAKKFLVMVPVSFMAAAGQALTQQFMALGENNPLKGLDFEVKLSVNPRLSWNDSFAVFRTDGLGGAKPFIRQQMGAPEYTHLGENSDLYHSERRMEFGAFVYRGLGYGLWQHAVKVTFTEEQG